MEINFGNLWETGLVIIILLLLFLLIYSKIKNKTLRESFEEIKDLFRRKE